MKTMKPLVVALAAILSLGTLATAAGYPEKDIQGIICWAAGGETDRFSRALTPLAEKHLGVSIVLNNKPGATGAIGMQAVHSSPADGYTLLYAAENPQLYGVLDIAKLDYKEFYPIQIMDRAIPVIAVGKDAPWNTFEELVNFAKANPGKVKMGTAGTGSLPETIGAMMKAATGIQMLTVPFDGTGPGITALLGGHIDVFPATVSGAIEHYRAGRLKILAVFNDAPVAGYETLPLVTTAYPAFAKYLPWGSFHGVFCHKDVPAEVKEKLVKAFKMGADEPSFKEFVAGGGAHQLNISGAEAEKFLTRWQSVTTWLLHDAGSTKKSPEEFGIPKP
jgi:tripartite-type tricarboxylate transporter receptor subunit TctC